MPAPRAVAFDMIETCFTLEPLRPRLDRAGLGPHALEPVFAAILRDAFALDTCGVYRPFREVAEGVLGSFGLDPDAVGDVLSGFSDLPAHPDVAPAMARVRAEGAAVIALTNGDAEVTLTLLDRAGLTEAVDRVISIDEIGRWKPAREVYLHAARTMDLLPGDVALVACHGWDCLGAARAGLSTGYVRRSGPLSAAMDPVDATGDTLTEVVDRLFAAG